MKGRKIKGSFTSQSRVPAKQQRFHFIDVHASWKCSSMILKGWAGGVWDLGGSNRRGGKAVVTITIIIIIIVDPFLGFAFSVLLRCVNELRSCLRESCCKTNA
jgi:hypothetical protein